MLAFIIWRWWTTVLLVTKVVVRFSVDVNELSDSMNGLSRAHRNLRPRSMQSRHATPHSWDLHVCVLILSPHCRGRRLNLTTVWLEFVCSTMSGETPLALLPGPKMRYRKKPFVWAGLCSGGTCILVLDWGSRNSLPQCEPWTSMIMMMVIGRAMHTFLTWRGKVSVENEPCTTVSSNDYQSVLHYFHTPHLNVASILDCWLTNQLVVIAAILIPTSYRSNTLSLDGARNDAMLTGKGREG